MYAGQQAKKREERENKIIILHLLPFLLILVVQEEETEDKNTKHHGECTGVVGICSHNETFILVVSEWSHCNLCSMVKACVAWAMVIEAEGKYSVDIRNLERSGVMAFVVVFESSTNVWIEHGEFELYVICFVRHPLGAIPFFNVYRVRLN